MKAIRPLALILAVLAGCVALASVCTSFVGWELFLTAEVAESAHSQQSCVDDVSITVDGVWEGFTYTLADPPDYADGDDIWIAYTVTNNSCGDVTVTVVLTGSVSGAAIHDADGSTAPCADGCSIPAGSSEYGTVQWDLGKHPNATAEKVVATVTVDAPSNFTDTDSSNNSDTSTESINIVNEVSTVDVAVKSVTASTTEALIGEEIDFTVVISNEGDSEVDATVTLDQGDDTEELDSVEVVDLAGDGESTVTLSWDTDGADAGAHSLRVLVESEGDGDSANDSKTVTVTLSEPSTDVAVTGVEPSSTEAVIGDTVAFTVSLENDGDVAVAPSVSLYQGESSEALDSTTSSTIAPGGTKTVTISWDTAEAEAGTHSLRAVATVADDDDPSNDSATVSLTLHDPVDVELSLTSPLAASAVKGNSVSVPFTVTNSGSNDTGEILISLYVSDVGQNQTTPQDEATATVSITALTIDESSSGALTWDTTDAKVSDYELELVAATAGDTDLSDNSVTSSIEIRNWLVLKSVSPQKSVTVVGEVVEFGAQVQNVGTEELTDITVGLFDLNVDGALGSTTISAIAAGSTGNATIPWDTTGRDVEVLDLIVAAGADGQDPDRDDSQFVSLEIRNPVALSSAVPAVQDNVAGLPVTINIQLLNESQAEITDVSVDLYVGDSEEATDSTEIETVAAGETVDATVTWDTGEAEPGEHQLMVGVNSPDYNADSNDTATLTVVLRAPVVAVTLTAATINRQVAAVGQTLDVVATISNHGEVAETVPIRLYLVDRLQQTTVASTGTSSRVEPGDSSEVTLQWDSTGTVVGTHMLKIAAELPEDTTTDDNDQIVEVELFQSAFDGVVGVDSCTEDVGVRVTDIRDRGDQNRSPPDYYVGEKVRATYSVYNFSCQTDLKLILTMNGPEGHAISDPDALCFSSCLVPFGGKLENDIEWTIPTLPALSDQPIVAAVSVAGPSDFVDANEANNTDSSTDRINIVHPDGIVLRLRDQTGDNVGTGASLIEPEFGAVDVRLVSVHPIQTTLPFATDTFEVAVAVANDGPTTEPTTVTFVLPPNDGANSRELHRHSMVIPTGQTRTETIEVPLYGVLPGVHTIEALLSAAVDLSTEDNAATFEITRVGPVVNVEMLDVSVSPDVLVLGDGATVSLTAHNKSEIALTLDLEIYVGDEPGPVATKTLDELAPGGQSREQISWRVPASARMLGTHTLKIVASSGDFGAIATADAEVTFHIDAEIVGIKTAPAETAMQGEEVSVEVEVQNNGPATVNVPITLHFPSATKNPETDHALTPTRSTGIASFTWKTRNYAVGEHTLIATVPEDHNITEGETSSELPFQLSPLTITATIVDVSSYPVEPSVGEPVSITVTVSNDGQVSARIPITLRFPPGGKQPETKRPHVVPGGTGTATFDWLTGNYSAGTHQFFIEIAAANSPQRRFTRDLLPVVENVSIVGMGTYPRETAMVGEPVEVWVDVRNDGPVALNVPVRLTFPSASKRPETPSPRLDPSETKRVFFEWKTSNYEPGDHTLSAAILLNDNITVGQTTEEIRFQLTPLVILATILDVAVSPDAPRLGDPVTVTVTVRNDGKIPTNIPVTLHFPSGDKQPETRRPRIEPGAIGTIEFTWRTSRHEPGNHGFLVEVASAPPSAHEFTIELLPPIVDVSIMAMGSDPSETAEQGQEVTVWVDVINNGPTALNVPVQLSFPPSGRQPERRSPRIAPGEMTRVEFTWKTANYEVGVHHLSAEVLAEYNVTDLDISATIEVKLISAQLIASIAHISWSPESPVVGEPVRIMVTVRNDGFVAARIPVTLHFPSGDKQPETRRPRIEPGAIGTIEFTWRTSRHEPGNHGFMVEVASEPSLMHQFAVELLPPIVDVAIVGMGSDPSETAAQGQEVTIWVDVINNGPTALNVPVQLSFPPSGRQSERRSPRIAPGEIARVEFIWKTANYDAGVHILTAELLAEYNITELDTSATIEIELIPARLVASIVDVSWSPESPVAREAVRITITVRNDGLVAASIPVTLHFPSGDKQPETRRPRIEPGAIGTIEFTWRTSRYEPGNHKFLIEVASEPPLMHQFAVELLPPIVDVAIVGMGSDPSETAVQGQAVTIWVDVINNGPSALNVPVQLTFPSSDKQPEQKSPRIEPGEIARVEFTWKTAGYAPGVHVLTAELHVEYNITELDTYASVEIRLIAAQLIASIVDVTWSPEAPVVSEPVRITITVRNNGLVAANIPVTLHFPSSDKQPETRRPRVAPGAVGSASFTWRTSRYEPGDHVFRVQIPGVAGAVRTFEIELRPPEVDFAVVDFQTPDPLHPIVKGDWVEITVAVQNQGPYAGRGTVYLLDAADLGTMYEQSASMEPGEFREVKFIWKTLRYPVGEYDLLARVDAEHDTDPSNDRSDQVPVHLLTDRDITVGFGSAVRPEVFAELTSKVGLSSMPRYRNDIAVVGNSHIPVDRPIAAVSDLSMGVSPQPTSGNYDPARMYWRWRAAQISPWECSRYQQAIGENLPRAVVCPKAPALVR